MIRWIFATAVIGVVAVVAALLVASTFATAASFTAGTEVALLPASLGEVSGLSHSRTNPDVFWVHNDSGDQPRVYAVS